MLTMALLSNLVRSSTRSAARVPLVVRMAARPLQNRPLSDSADSVPRLPATDRDPPPEAHLQTMKINTKHLARY